MEITENTGFSSESFAMRSNKVFTSKNKMSTSSKKMNTSNNKTTNSHEHISCHWFRKNLRLHDNPALNEAIINAKSFYGIFILPEINFKTLATSNRWKFLIQCLVNLDKSLRALGSELIILTGSSTEIFPKLFRGLGVTKLSYEIDSEPFAKQRDWVIRHLAEEAGVEVKEFVSHTLYNIDALSSACQDELPMQFDQFLEMISHLGPPMEPTKDIHFLPHFTVENEELFMEGDLNVMSLKVMVSELDNFVEDGTDKKNIFCKWPGGEDVGLKKLQEFVEELLANDFQPLPPSAEVLSSSRGVLDPYLRFGCLSPRKVYQSIHEAYVKVKQDSPPASIYTSLMWREYSFLLGSENPDLHKMEGNPYCLQVPWASDHCMLEKLKMGQTGFPWIDAIMRQLKEEGWIHPLAQQAVTCFLTFGTLWISWEEGFKIFGELLLDAGWSRNACNWLYMSRSMCVDKPIPYLCPVTVGKKVDPHGEYVRQFVPEVRHLPEDYLFEPWKAPLKIQQSSRCVVGKDYPAPLVDHTEKRKICSKKLQNLCLHLEGKVTNLGHTSVHWFRKDLRLHDNPALLASLENCSIFYPIFILDTEAARRSKISANRWNFLCECLKDLDSELRALGSRLFVVRGRAMEVLPRLLKEWSVTRLTFETDTEPAGRQRDSIVRLVAEKSKVDVVQHSSHTLYEVADVVDANSGKLPVTFEDIRKAAEKLGSPSSPARTVEKSVFGSCVTPVRSDHAELYGPPELAELGSKTLGRATATKYWKGGEQEGLRRLDAALDKSKKSLAPPSLFEGLLRREYFLQVASHNANVHTMANNPLSVQFPWEENPEGLQRWKEGKTGFPWIDAIMRQLRDEGWIHHLARQAVGCFLTRGCLWISWEEGFKAFDELQLDAEWGLNAGNWLWLSCSTYVEGAVPWYCPVDVAKRVDETGDYIKRYVPEVRDLPVEYLFEPWKAPLRIQQSSKCLVGRDYPAPIVDHMEQRIVCVQRLRQLVGDLGLKVPNVGHTSVHWFRKDLRLHDNPALLASLENCSTFYPIFILDTEAARRSKISANRWNFLCECLKDLDSELRALGSRLFVVRGRAMEVLPRLFKEWSVTRLTFETDTEPAGRQRDSIVRLVAEKSDVNVVQHSSHTLYEVADIVDANSGKVPVTFEDIRKATEKLGSPSSLARTVEKSVFGSCVTPVRSDHAELYGFSELAELGGKALGRATATKYWKGGEQEGLRRLDAALDKIAKNDFVDQNWTAKDMLPSETHLSPYMRFGCLSPRLYYHRLAVTYVKSKKSVAPPSLFEGLLRREYFLQVASHNANVHTMANNPLSVQFPWEENPEGLQRWKEGKTGFPWIDAIMRQLRDEGWIHHLARQAVGCFLTRGCLWISWEEGFKAFDELQLDAEWGLNAGNWLWLSCSTYVDGAVPWYCPVDVAKRVDETGDYIKRYVPEVRGLPVEYLFEPWKAPLGIQQSSKCVVGRDYPAPIVDHMEQRIVCVQRLRQLVGDLGLKVPNVGHTSVHWFRKDLRLHDNPALLASLENCSTFYPIFILDTEAARRSKISANRWNFLCECLKDLDSELRALGSRLFVVRGRAMEVLPRLFKEWSVTRLTFETDTEPAGRQRDSIVRLVAEKSDVNVVQHSSHTLYEVADVVDANSGKVPVTFEDIRKAAEKLGSPSSPAMTVEKSVFGSCVTPVRSDHAELYGPPELAELGGKALGRATATKYWKGGEQEGLRRLDAALDKIAKNDFVDQNWTAKDMLPSETHLSPYMRFGCLSPRLYYHRLAVIYVKSKKSLAPQSLFEGLLRREYFLQVASHNANVHTMANNPLSVQFPWEENPEGLQRWKEGKTGFPWIDAIMRQLRDEGWIHHLARQAVGCFLTRGCLWISWEEGFKAFDELQLDAEWGLNAGNWLWLSCSTYVEGAVPWYCPVDVAKRVDETGDYIKRYVPEVRGLPVEYLFEPWKAPLRIQQSSKCVVGRDYPAPIVDHMEQRIVCVQRMRQLVGDLGLKVPNLGQTSVHWFRKDLRLHDNPALLASLENCSTFYPIFILDTEAARRSKISANRWNFLCECLKDLDSELRALGSRLFVVRGRAMEVLPRLFKEWSVTRLTFETDTEPAGRQRDSIVRLVAEKSDVNVVQHSSHTLYEVADVVDANSEKVPVTFEDIRKAAEKLGSPSSPAMTVEKSVFGSCVTPVRSDHAELFGPPELAELGSKTLGRATATKYWKGGEQEGLRRLDAALDKIAKNDFVDQNWTAKDMLPSETHLSPYMRFGCISPRLYYHRLAVTYVKSKKSLAPQSLFEGLLRREYFLQVASHNANVHTMANNPLSVQFPWEENPEGLQRWKEGKTGFPWIDAIMRQLRDEGWIHHLARQAVGCFLTRGCLWISWEEGFKAFDELQLDAEWGLNAGNWLWLSCSTYVEGAVPWYCPVDVAKRVDETGDYIKRYVPEVRGLPVEYLFEPWKAPLRIQQSSKCLVGRDYPAPIVDHMEQRIVCVQRLRQLVGDLGLKVPNVAHTSVHWFRKDLRLHDNPALLASLENCSTFYPIFILDTEAARRSKISANRWNFLCECLKDLDSELRALGSRLFVVRGRAMEVLPRLFKEWSVTRLTFETDTEPAGRQRDSIVRLVAEKSDVNVVQHSSHTLYEVADVVDANSGKVPVTFEDIRKAAEKLGSPSSPARTVEKSVFGSCVTPVRSDHAELYGPPELAELGGKALGRATATKYWKGGEQEGLRRLDAALDKIAKNDFVDQNWTAKDMLPSETHLSPYMRFGCISPRLYYHRLAVTYVKSKKSLAPQSLFEGLLRREYFLQVASHNANVHTMANNPLSVQFPWEENPEGLQRWKEGKTGFPWIDAIMRQLRDEGWIHHLARQAVGCFLTRGCLWISWEEGFKAFDELQLDAEWGLNAGNWLWLSCSTYVEGAVPWYCPVDVAKRVDETGDYIKRYVPEVRGLPVEYLFEPWKAPLRIQQSSKCLVGRDYPAPIVDHMEQRIVCVQRLRQLVGDLGLKVPNVAHTSVHWFRKDLRLHDNPALLASLENCSTFYPIFILDTEAARRSKISANRWNFLCECLKDLDSELRVLGSRLFVVRGRAMEVLPRLFKEWSVTRLTFETDTEPAGRQRDSIVRLVAEKSDVNVVQHSSHTLYEVADVVDANSGKVPVTFEDIRKAAEKLGSPNSPARTVEKSVFGSCVTPVRSDHAERYGPPELAEFGGKALGRATAAKYWKGGEQEGLRRLSAIVEKIAHNDFSEPKVSIDDFYSSDTHVSPFMRLGCVSPRIYYGRLKDAFMKAKGENPPQTLFRPLLVRELFLHMAYDNESVHRMVDNPVSIQFPWEEDRGSLFRWKQGTTGFPWIDAIMRQLRAEGWIHHLARQAVGCFLTRGCLWISWEEGFKAFDELQLDAEWGLNAGNWLWLSCSTYVDGAVPWYCPVEFGKKMDPTGRYIKRYVPEVRHLPGKYVHEPWNAPLQVQIRARCVVGDDYPERIYDHIEQRKVCVDKLKALSYQLEPKQHNTMHWFRKDLRLHDNPSLVKALRGSQTFYGVYFLDPQLLLTPEGVLPRTVDFLLQSLKDLDVKLKQHGSRLFVVRGRPLALLPSFLKEWRITRLSFEKDADPHAACRDDLAKRLAAENSIEVISETSHTIFDVECIPKAANGSSPLVFSHFKHMVSTLRIPAPAETVGGPLLDGCLTPVKEDHELLYGVPQEFRLGPKFGKCVRKRWNGGETEALRRLEVLLSKMRSNNFVPPPINADTLLDSKNALSPYMRFGCISPRYICHRVHEEYYQTMNEPPPPSLFEKFLWRDFFFSMSSSNAELHRMEGNTMSLQFPWEDHPYELDRWKQGKTGFPWIDAIMRQLRDEGWIHHLARQAVGCFLTRGCLWISWEEGFKAFDELQLDAEWGLNAGNWLWLSCSTYVEGAVPWYCPVDVAKRVDPTGRYIRTFVPELKALPTEFLFEPWKAPLDVQGAAGCRVGKDYPYPMVDHQERRQICIQKLQELKENLSYEDFE